MDGKDENRKAFVERLADENRKLYGTPEGRGALRAFDLTFEHRWLYLFELVQNALDAGACSVAFRLTEAGDALIFQHNGGQELDEGAVAALSKVLVSTKGASTVGFMGIGFKSVFGRFREARVSGWGWTFRYKIDQVEGEKFGDVQPNLLGAVVPIWDDSIPAPQSGFTTRFEMRQGESGQTDLRDDLVRFLSDDDLTPLAILAASELKRLEVDGRLWELKITEDSDGTLKVAATSEGQNRFWRLFPSDFQPSKEAIARFLEHRRIQPAKDEREQVYAEAARRRRVLGVLPLNHHGTPEPPARGRVYATLPTGVTLPLRLHINADWLVNISRSGLREIEDNPWQRGFVDRIADLLVSFLKWVTRSFSEPAAVTAAFSVLAPSSPDGVGLEALLANEHWLSILRAELEDAAVLPVWTGASDTLAFATPSDAIVPPPPLADAFREQPLLLPSVLLNGPVLMDAVLGKGALGLLRQTGLLTEMSPQDLEREWPDGLARWWKNLSDDPKHRRALLIRIWAAVAKLTDEDAWVNADLRCIRTVAGQWLPADQIVFFDEPFPSEREPGGKAVHEFLQPFILDANRLPNRWIEAIRRGAENEIGGIEPFSRTKKWIEHHGRHMSLREVVGDALKDLASLTPPDWSVLVPLGRWARHRNRPDLLTRVLVESDNGPLGIPTNEALLAAPYVEPRQSRLHLFPNMSVVSTDYMEHDPQNASAREWRRFFEQAGVKGKLEVREMGDHARRWRPERVAEFLGLMVSEISASNDRGYQLLDFDIEANLPGADAPKEIRKAFAAWLEDGCNALQGKGKRKAEWRYRQPYYRCGSPSAWVVKLIELPWVPCKDGELRRPKDVLPKPDPSREDAPAAELSPDLLRILDQEGVKFGGAIPEATAMRKLAATGTRLDVEELAHLLRECREDVAKDEDRRQFEQVLRELTVPSDDNHRVPLDRVVRRAGGRSGARGALGGWIVPLDQINEVLRSELDHADFPHELADTTTGSQALAYIKDVWRRAQSPPEGLASDVRDLLPTAYAYCLEDCAEDDSLAKQWRVALHEAAVFADQEWVVLIEADDIYFDDINDRRFLPENMQLRTATGGHLGNSQPDQLRTAKALNLGLLSNSIEMKWRGQDELLPVEKDCISRFDLICRLLQRVRGREQWETGGTEVETGMALKLARVRELVLEVRAGETPAEQVPVDARLQNETLTVAGRPVQFASDAAKELLRHFSFGQRAELAADLAGMLGAIDNMEDFNLAADKFRRSFTPDFKLPAMVQLGSNAESAAGAEGGDGEANSTGGSFTRDRALAQSNGLAEKLKNSLKGEVVPSDQGDLASEATEIDDNLGAGIGDEEYREAAMKYEREAGRDPELGDPHQKGWDICSTDPKTQEVRLIEVKGKGRPWEEEEVVELSRAQVRTAFKTLDEGNAAWYLYVVEKTGDSCRVLPVENPVGAAAKWMLCGKSWRMVAEAEVRRDHPS